MASSNQNSISDSCHLIFEQNPAGAVQDLRSMYVSRDKLAAKAKVTMTKHSKSLPVKVCVPAPRYLKIRRFHKDYRQAINMGTST